MLYFNPLLLKVEFEALYGLCLSIGGDYLKLRAPGEMVRYLLITVPTCRTTYAFLASARMNE